MAEEYRFILFVLLPAIGVIALFWYVWRVAFVKDAPGAVLDIGGPNATNHERSRPGKIILAISVVISLATLAYPFYPFLGMYLDELGLSRALSFVLFFELPILQLFNAVYLARWRRKDLKENRQSPSRLNFALRLAAFAVVIPFACFLLLIYILTRSDPFPVGS